MINFSIVSAPCHGFQTLAELPAESASDDFLVASLLPELAFVELAAPMLDAGGSSAGASSPTPRLDWRAPAPARYWRSPELRPGRAAANRPLWLAAAPPATQPLLVRDSTPGSDPGPWQPGALPSGSDPLPLPGVFGALPLEQQAGNCVIFGEVASGLEPVAKAFVDVIGTGRVAETDAQGRFRIEGLPAGDFTVEASALNYSPQVLGVSPNPAAPVELRFNLTVKPADIRKPAPAISSPISRSTRRSPPASARRSSRKRTSAMLPVPSAKSPVPTSSAASSPSSAVSPTAT